MCFHKPKNLYETTKNGEQVIVPNAATLASDYLDNIIEYQHAQFYYVSPVQAFHYFDFAQVDDSDSDSDESDSDESESFMTLPDISPPSPEPQAPASPASTIYR